MYRCSFCGLQFSKEQAINACGSCPLSNCELVKCPNCGYESLPEAKSLTWLKNLFSKKKKTQAFEKESSRK